MRSVMRRFSTLRKFTAGHNERPLIVKKFGGTSLNCNRMKNVVDIIGRSSESNRMLVVVSAISPEDKLRGTTSLLLKIANAVLKDEDVNEYMTQLENTHHDVLRNVIQDKTCSFEASEHVYHELKSLSGFLDALRVIKEMSPRSMDNIIGVGERLSAGILACALRSAGLKAQYFDLSSVCKEGVDATLPGYHLHVQKNIGDLLNGKPNGLIPILTGFMGHFNGGIMETVGRGYSDLTAALVAAELNAEELQVWKEVSGIFSADPNKVKEAQLLSSVTPMEAAELTYFGSEVLHPFTMNVAIGKGIPIRIKNTCEPDMPGTAVFPPGMTGEDIDLPYVVKAVTVKKGVNVLSITPNRMCGNTNTFLVNVFSVLNKHKTIVDLVNISEAQVSIAINKKIVSGVNSLNAILEDLSDFADSNVRDDRAILSIIGQGIVGRKGVAAQMFTSLAEAGVNIEMISQGASEVNVSCVVCENEVDGAMEAAHRGLILTENAMKLM